MGRNTDEEIGGFVEELSHGRKGSRTEEKEGNSGELALAARAGTRRNSREAAGDWGMVNRGGEQGAGSCVQGIEWGAALGWSGCKRRARYGNRGYEGGVVLAGAALS
jgi:hypothetical protein